MSIGSPYLTDENPVFEETDPGMAHFSGTGPDNTYCFGCMFFNRESLESGWCDKYAQLTNVHKQIFYAGNMSCRYFENIRQ